MIIIGQVGSQEKLEAHFELSYSVRQEYKSKYFIGHGDPAWIITCHKNKAFSLANYGLIPFWSTKEIYHYEAPVEGSVDPMAEHVKKRIIQHPSYRRPIRDTRCIIPADYFIIPNSSGMPYLFFSLESRPFALAGVYDSWKERSSDIDLYEGFSIITLPANKVVNDIGINRFPLVLSQKHYKRWLKPDAALMEITKIMEPLEDFPFNGFPINKELFTQKLDGKDLIKPAGPLILPDEKMDYGKVASFLRSFRYKRGLTHPKNDQEQRIWRGTV